MNKDTNWLGRVLELDIEKVAHGGIFVARHEGRVVFVSHVLPGEKVRALVYEDRGGAFCRAEPQEILNASPDRVEHVWDQAGVGGAGGAEFGHIRLARQRELKADVIEEALQRMAGIDRRVEVEAVDGDEENNGLGYRTRVQLHVNEFGDAGPYMERSHDVVLVRDLPLAVEEIREAALHAKNWSGVKKIDIAASNTGQLQWKVDDKIKGDERLVERAAGRTFRISGGGFWQVHRKAADLLAKTVLDMIDEAGFNKSANNLDLYGGVGLFASSLASRFGNETRVTTVEAFKRATEDATLNIADMPKAKTVLDMIDEAGFNKSANNLDLYGGVGLFASSLASRFGNETRVTTVEAFKRATEDATLNIADMPNAKAVCAQVDRFLQDQQRAMQQGASFNNATVVLDPPRAGAGAKVVGLLVDLAPQQIVYVACDPVALARDLKALMAGGYEIASMRAFDLFAHTHHVETVVSLVRK